MAGVREGGGEGRRDPSSHLDATPEEETPQSFFEWAAAPERKSAGVTSNRGSNLSRFPFRFQARPAKETPHVQALFIALTTTLLVLLTMTIPWQDYPSLSLSLLIDLRLSSDRM